MRERLRVVAEMAPRGRLELLPVQTEVREIGEQPLAEVLGLTPLADLRERGDQPERADQERPLRAAQAVVGLVGAIAQDETLLGQLLADRVHGGTYALVVRGQETK